MKCIADIWYTGFAELTELCNINEVTVRQGIRRESPQWESIADPDDRRKRLIRYDTMAPKYQSIVRRVLCGGLEPWEIAAKKSAEVLSERRITELVEIALTTGFRRYCGLYPADDTSRAALKTQTCLARAAAVVERIGTYIQERDIDPKSYKMYYEVEAWLKQDDNYNFYFPKGNQYLPLNPIRLKEKVVQRFGKPGVEPQPITEVIRLPREGNKSRDKFAGDAELMAWIAMARMQGTNDPNAYIIRKISEVCRIVGRDVPSNSWFSQVLASGQMKQLTAEPRFGTGTKQAGRYTHSITMARAMYAGDCWMMDATRVNMIEHETTEKGKYAFLYIIAVRDAYSGDIVGVHFDTKEDRWAYTNALKMAVKSTGYLPHTLVYDRFPGHLSDEMQSILDAMERKGVNLVCTHKATGKALLERWFDTLQTVFLSKSKYYYGQGIMSTRSYAHRSPEYLLKVRKEAKAEGWDFDRAWQEAWQRIEEYRQTPVSYYSRKHKGLDLSPATLHQQSEKPNVVAVELWDQASLFWMTKVLDIRRNRLEQEVHGVRYEYPIYDETLLYRYERVAIRYEEADPAKVMLFAVGADDRVTDFFITELAESTPITMYGPNAEPSRLAGRQEKIKQFEGRKRADLQRAVNAATVDPEYLLNLGGRVPKEEFESVQTAIIYEQMGVSIAANAQAPAKGKQPKPPKLKVLPTATSDVPFDPKTHVYNSFFNQ
ncbi:DDE-type integrase/transposase/recombinase [Spirosoma areae]